MSCRPNPPLMAAPPGGWSWTRLGWVVMAILGIHIVLLFALSRRSDQFPHQRVTDRLFAPLVWDDSTTQDHLSSLLPNPVVFARVVSGGFSGSLWNSDAWGDSGKVAPPPLVLRPSVREDSVLRPRLDIRLAGLDDRNAATLSRIEPPPRPQLPPAQSLFSGQSILRLREGLSGWRPVVNGALPVWTNAQLLTPTVVQITLDSQGGVLSATLELGSGLAEADQDALKRARQLRFVHPPNQALTNGPHWGRLEFVWHTVPPGQGASPAAP